MLYNTEHNIKNLISMDFDVAVSLRVMYKADKMYYVAALSEYNRKKITKKVQNYVFPSSNVVRVHFVRV